ncbi:aldo/keto reductase [Fictibacillus gelatini]|uniref:aldo/keto reductase n=1 Tax=Fictibacillus gelatini TaxID=225985 RepID=UPI00041E4D51|nr:aldo/keto reductase [Fictibacillus gelatini]
MVKSIQDTTTLHNGVKMPWVGLGVYKAEEGEEVIRAVKAAISAGYRSIDTASLYQNEEGVGKAIKECGVPREKLFITTKVWNTDQGYDSTLTAFEESRKKLDLDYVDLYLVHWPVKEKYKETWRALEKLYKDGKVKAIGVSNFQIHHLEDIMADCEIKPMVNQVECHPQLSQKELLAFCKENDIQLEAWRPLLKGEILNDPVLTKIAEQHQKSVAQVTLRWHLQNGIVVIPKSVNENRIKENGDLFDFELSPDEMRQIDALNINKRNGQDPDNFKF